MPPTVAIALTSPHTTAARGALRDYFTDIVGRYYGRAATTAEVDYVLADTADDVLEPPRGLFWLAVDGGADAGERVLGCAGLRFVAAGIGEVTRVWVCPDARRRGVASALLATVEAAGLEHGLSLLRLDTRDDLVEARALYARCGFAEVPAFNDEPYAHHWFAKPIG